LIRRSGLVLVLGTFLLALVVMPRAAAATTAAPDLKVTEESWVGSPDCSQLTVRVEVTNIGNADAGKFVLTYQWSFAGPYEQLKKTFKKLNAGSSRTVEFVIAYSADELMDNIFTADAKHQVAESDETNNEATDQDVYCFS
jgi:hypothetical protein